MASLHLSFSSNLCEPTKKLTFCVGYGYAPRLSAGGYLSFSHFFNHVNASGSCAFFGVSKLKHVYAARFESELVEKASLSGSGSDGSGGDVGSLGKEGLVGEGLMLREPNQSTSSRKGSDRDSRRRFRGVRRTKDGKKSSNLDVAERSNVVVGEDGGGDELDVGFYGIKVDSSVKRCNRVLFGLEKNNDSKAVKFFEWMRKNGKLEGNVDAYNLVLRVLGRRGDWDRAESLIKEMKFETGCELEFRVFNTVIYACFKKGLVDVGAKWFRMMLEYDVEPNVATFGMVMRLYRTGWNLKEARFAFSKMRQLKLRCQFAYSSMITIYTRLHLYSQAEEVIGLLLKDEVVADLEIWLAMLNAYGLQGKMSEAEKLLVSMHESGVPPNIDVYNVLIAGYGKVSNMDAAEDMFQNLQNVDLQPDETTYRSMIEGWAKSGNNERAQWYYVRLKDLGFRPNSSSLISLINLQATCDNHDGAIKTIDDMLDINCQPSSIIGSLIQAYEKAGNFDRLPLVVRSSLYERLLASQTSCSLLAVAYVKHSMVDETLKLLKDKCWKDQDFEDNLYHLLICSCKESGQLEKAVKIFIHMPKSDDKPNVHILSTMIAIYGAMNQFSDADKIYRLLKSSGASLDLVAYSVVVRMYVRAGQLEDACSVLDDMSKQTEIVPDVYMLRDMLRLYQRCDKRDKLEELYYKTLKSGVTWDQEMYNCVINCCARAIPSYELSNLFDEMILKGFTPNTITYNVILDVFGKSKLFKKARKVFGMAKKQGLTDVISYNTLIAAYGRNKDFENMTTIVHQMQFDGFSVSLEAYNCMLDAYGKERQMESFRAVLRRLKDSSCTPDHYTYNILINIYGEQRWIEEVAAVLTELKEYGPGPDLCGYNTLIKAYGIAGMVEDAFSVIKEMRENGVEPDRITYLNWIWALKRNEMILEAVKWSLLMKQMGFS